MSARDYPASAGHPGSADTTDDREYPQCGDTGLRPYQPPAVKVFPVAELVRSGGGSNADAFGEGEFE
jgi:hypothetical protein